MTGKARIRGCSALDEKAVGSVGSFVFLFVFACGCQYQCSCMSVEYDVQLYLLALSHRQHGLSAADCHCDALSAYCVVVVTRLIQNDTARRPQKGERYC